MHRRLTLLRKSSQPQRILPQHFPCKWSLNCGRFADSGRCGFPRLLILTLSSSCVHVPANPNPLLCVSTHTPSLSLVSLILLHSAGGSRSSCPRCRGYHLMPISAISCSAGQLTIWTLTRILGDSYFHSWDIRRCPRSDSTTVVTFPGNEALSQRSEAKPRGLMG